MECRSLYIYFAIVHISNSGSGKTFGRILSIFFPIQAIFPSFKDVFSPHDHVFLDFLRVAIVEKGLSFTGDLS